MPTNTEREYYAAGFRDGMRAAHGDRALGMPWSPSDDPKPKRTKRKLSAWNKFVKANSKKKIYRYANGKLKLKKMGIAFRKKKRR